MSNRVKTNRRRLVRGQAINKMLLVLIGAGLIGLGIAVQGQSWTTPEMFAGLGLDVSKVIINVGLFLLFIQVINIYFYAPLKEAMDERNKELETTFSDAEQLRAQMQTMRSDYEQRLAATEAEARSQIQAQIKEAQELRQSLMSEASAKADELVKRAQEEIESEKQKVLSQLRAEVVNLTLAASERVLGENMDTDKNRRLVAEFIDKVEVPS